MEVFEVPSDDTRSEYDVVDEPPVVQESEIEGCVDIVWPQPEGEPMITTLPETVAMNVFSDVMRIVTGVDPEEQPVMDDEQRDP